MLNYFPMNWFQDISMCIDSRQSIQLCPYHMGCVFSNFGMVQSQLRNQLGLDKAAKLVM